MSNLTKTRHKNDPLRGARWDDLATVGDVQRYLKWIILQTKADKMPINKASVMGQLGLYVLRTIEASHFESRIDELERRLAQSEQLHGPTEATSGTPQLYDSGNSSTTH